MKSFRELQIVEIAGSPGAAFAAKMSADYGASVVQLEPPGGDPLPPNGEPRGGVGTEFAFFNTSKRSVELDLGTDSGLRQLDRLLLVADAVIESSAPNPLTLVSADLGDDQLVRVYVSPFGLNGPYAR